MKRKQVIDRRVVLAWLLQKPHGKFSRPSNRRHDLLDSGNRVRFRSEDSIAGRFVLVRPAVGWRNYNYYYEPTVSYRFGLCVRRQQRFSKGSWVVSKAVVGTPKCTVCSHTVVTGQNGNRPLRAMFACDKPLTVGVDTQSCIIVTPWRWRQKKEITIII